MNNNEVVYNESERNKIQREEKTKEKSKKKKKMFWIIFSIAGALVVTAIIVFIILTKKKGGNNNGDDNIEISDNIITPGDEIKPQYKKLQKIFDIVTNVGEIKRVFVQQRSLDETKVNNNTLSTKVLRKTNYDIYTISEEDSDEDNKLFYSKMYTNAISIVSECISTDGNDCEPRRLVDLTSAKRTTTRRVLNSMEDFKDIPIALCLFNITDNNFITSMTCPESFSENKKMK